MDFDAARTRMVDNQIRTTDVTRHEILRAFLEVPREEFVPAARKPLAYIDEDVPLGNGRFIMEASPFAKLIQLAAIRPDDVVLDVGCGTGYSSAVLSHLAGSVVSLEQDPELAEAATENLARLDYVTCAVVEGPLNEGYPSEAPFDVIFVQGSVDILPETLLEQLRDGGRLVVVEGQGNAAEAKLYFKDGNGVVGSRFGFNCSIRPLPGFQRKAEFAF
ncbi:protein-L-isoaspartate O-methyltransferase family protein [Aurantimonas coralicida]|uniref:protein-L-isoaspartate O-methyltransferase family protein n=1 Tax=Aurantimonas coralicida TaxID=182270 RepID=UPI001E295729|nr:protein-L-isoaspartate O-methyltransferase [Aurantimonas coralicida]MCD1643412.1 protein-L-isoaspartate O-methyltransferase [Aurantimonas coralicida]